MSVRISDMAPATEALRSMLLEVSNSGATQRITIDLLLALLDPDFLGLSNADAALSNRITDLDDELLLYARLVDPTFTGAHAAPTAVEGTNTNQIATTKFVATGLGRKANLASPTFTGAPAAPTAATSSSSTQLATTAFVRNLLAGTHNIAAAAVNVTTQPEGDNTTLAASTAFVKRAVSSLKLGMPYLARAANTQLVADNNGAFIDATGSFTQAFATPSNLGADWHCFYRNSGTGDIMIPASDNVTDWVMYPGEVRLFYCDGTTLRSIVLVRFSKMWLVGGVYKHPPGYKGVLSEAMNGGSGGGSGQRIATTTHSLPAGGGPGGPGGGFRFTPQPIPLVVGETLAVSVGSGGLGATVPNSASTRPGGFSGLAGIRYASNPERNGAAGGGGGGANRVSGDAGVPGATAEPDGLIQTAAAAIGGTGNTFSSQGAINGGAGESPVTRGYSGGGGGGSCGGSTEGSTPTNVGGPGGRGAFPGGGGGGGGGTQRPTNNYTASEIAPGGDGAQGYVRIEGVI